MSITSQWKGDIRLGAMVSLVSYTAFWISLMNFVLVSLIAYNTTIKTIVWEFAPWFNFWWYLAFIAVVVLIIMVIEYKVIIPSRQRFLSGQEYAHESPIRRDLESLKEDNMELRKELAYLRTNNSDIKEHLKSISKKLGGNEGDVYCYCGSIIKLPRIYRCSSCGKTFELEGRYFDEEKGHDNNL